MIYLIFFFNNNNNINLYEIEKYSYVFFQTLMSIFDNCINKYKLLIENNLKKDNIYNNNNSNDVRIGDIEEFGYKNWEIVQCLQEGINKKIDIVNYLVQVHHNEEKQKKKKR